MEAIISVTAVFSLAMFMILAFVLVRNYQDQMEFEHRMNHEQGQYHPHTNDTKIRLKLLT